MCIFSQVTHLLKQPDHDRHVEGVSLFWQGGYNGCRSLKRYRQIKQIGENYFKLPHFTHYMVGNNQNTAVISPTEAGVSGLISGSPKAMYVFFLLKLCDRYFEVMRVNTDSDDDRHQIDSATGALVAFCPNEGKREELWNYYLDHKDDAGLGALTASVHTVGKLVSYLSESLEFEEEATGGLI